MDTSGISLKEYWKDYNILIATDNIKIAWEELNCVVYRSCVAQNLA
jgi:hypothetical protein